MPAQRDGETIELAEISITVRATLGPIVLEIPAKPAQIAMVVRMATQELISAGIIGQSVAEAAKAKVDDQIKNSQKAAA